MGNIPKVLVGKTQEEEEGGGGGGEIRSSLCAGLPPFISRQGYMWQ
jgi:hypothetical protein